MDPVRISRPNPNPRRAIKRFLPYRIHNWYRREVASEFDRRKLSFSERPPRLFVSWITVVWDKIVSRRSGTRTFVSFAPFYSRSDDFNQKKNQSHRFVFSTARVLSRFALGPIDRPFCQAFFVFRERKKIKLSFLTSGRIWMYPSALIFLFLYFRLWNGWILGYRLIFSSGITMSGETRGEFLGFSDKMIPREHFGLVSPSTRVFSPKIENLEVPGSSKIKKIPFGFEVFSSVSNWGKKRVRSD